MPSIDKIASFTITPEQFLDACSAIELKEIDILLCKVKYQKKMYELKKGIEFNNGSVIRSIGNDGGINSAKGKSI